MNKILGFVLGLGMVVLTGLVSAGPTSCILECREDFADCREDGGSNCSAQLAACRANCG